MEDAAAISQTPAPHDACACAAPPAGVAGAACADGVDTAPPAWATRVPGALLAVACLTVLLVGSWLTPDPAGIGTHTQLGLNPCGFEAATGLPCATCGMTTATALAAHGRLLDAFVTQPAGAAFALCMAMGTLLGAWSALGGWSLAAIGQTVASPRGLIVVIAVVLVAWGYKILLVFL